MKILLTIHHLLDPNAGAPGVTLSLGKAYQSLGHEVYYYSYDNMPERFSGKMTSILFPFYVVLHIRKISREFDLDVIHASSGDAWIWGSIWKYFGSARRPLLVTQSHGLEHTMHEQILEEAKNNRLKLSWKYPLYNGSILLWKVARSFQMANLCFMLNQYDARTVKDKIGVVTDRVKVFPNGIPDEFIGLPFELFQPELDGLPGIAFLGSYIDRKGIQYGVPALNNLMERYLKLRVIFLGTGGTVDRVLNDFSPAVRDRITVVPSFDKPELPRLLKDSHILLFPSLSEGFPLALPEAMACGLAPIVTDIPGPTEIVVNGENGFIVQPRDQLQLQQAMEKLINDLDCLQKLRRKAYQVAQNYNWSSIVQQHLELYENVLNNQKISNTKTNPVAM
jgi:glycosyltransferase involved in cell wall biosynthesis